MLRAEKAAEVAKASATLDTVVLRAIRDQVQPRDGNNLFNRSWGSAPPWFEMLWRQADRQWTPYQGVPKPSVHHYNGRA